MACAESNNPNKVCVSFDGTNWSFSPDELDFDNSSPGNNPILLQRDGTGWTFESFSWTDQPPTGVFGTPVVTASTITITDNDSQTGNWSYTVCVTYNGTSKCSDPKIVNM
jgi:hypothetical protein